MTNIFISRDKHEYALYDEYLVERSLDFEPGYTPCNFLWKKVEENGDDIVCVVETVKGEDIDNWKNALCSESPDASGLWKLVEEIEKQVLSGKTGSNGVRLFIHFGGGANPVFEEGKSEKAFKRLSDCRTVQVFAVSSTRSELFNVGEEKKGCPKPFDVPVSAQGLAALAKRFYDAREIPPDVLEKDGKRLLQCTRYEDFWKLGIRCPREFVVEKGDDADSRFAIVDKVSDEQIVDWCSGFIRKYLRLSPTVHGVRGQVRPELGDKESGLQDVLDTKARNPDYDGFHELLEKVYPAIAKFKAAQTIEDLRRLYSDKTVIPSEIGYRAGFLTPSGKLRMLLIDDEAETWKEKILKEDPAKRIFEIETLSIKPLSDEGCSDSADEQVREKLLECQRDGISYDLVLIDLCLGEESPEKDLEGYGIIRLVRNFLPGTPIVMYSQYDDRGHVRRAYQEGATWFLKKSEEYKLPRHVLRILEHAEWRREWNSKKVVPTFLPLVDGADAFAKEFVNNDEWAYLTWKSLEDFPGNHIFVEKMSGGISTSVTFKANKGVSVKGVPLQMPNIIKIDDQFKMMAEYERYSRFIRPYMANEAGRIERPERAIDRKNACIVYTYAGKQDDRHTLKSMASRLKRDLDSPATSNYDNYEFVVDHLFDDILSKIHRIPPDLEFKEKICDDEVTPPYRDNDAFSGLDHDALAKTSFPNIYFDEYGPKDFFKSYISRFLPWYDIELQQNGDEHRLTFHAVGESDSSYWLEAYDTDGRLCNLKGAKAEFLARFRPQIYPGDTLVVQGIKEKCAYKADKFVRKQAQELFQNLMTIATKVPSNAKKWGMKCPLGIVHGDLNLNNIMLESVIGERKISDAWLIDFARTRRDLIAHDFNVFYTSVLGELLSMKGGVNKSIIEKMVQETVVYRGDNLDSIPGDFYKNEQKTLVWKLLYRCRLAAIKSGISDNMYLLTTGLACLVAGRIFADKNIEKKAKGFYDAAKKCYDILKENLKELGATE